MDDLKQYVQRDHQAQGEHYLRHVSAMTGEGLHAKSAIAGELAHRDIEIARLTAERDALQAKLDALQEDADRYRWLRDMDEDPVCSLAAMWTDCKGSARSISKRVDAAVDAARGKNTT
jgi:hypothetical protein